MPTPYLSALAVALAALSSVAAQTPVTRAKAPVASRTAANKVQADAAGKRSPAAPAAILLPEAHNGQIYLTKLVGAGAFHLPVTCQLDARVPKWLTFDCNAQQFYGVAAEPGDVQYTFTVTMQGSGGDKAVSYTMQLPVRFGADVAVVHGSAPRLPSAPAVTPAAAAVVAPGAVHGPAPASPTASVAPKPSIKATSQVVGGAQSISGTVGGLPPGPPATAIQASNQPDGQPAQVSAPKPAPNTLAVVQPNFSSALVGAQPARLPSRAVQ